MDQWMLDNGGSKLESLYSYRESRAVTANVSARCGILNRFRENRIFRLTHANHVHDSTAANTSLVDLGDSIQYWMLTNSVSKNHDTMRGPMIPVVGIPSVLRMMIVVIVMTFMTGTTNAFVLQPPHVMSCCRPTSPSPPSPARSTTFLLDKPNIEVISQPDAEFLEQKG